MTAELHTRESAATFLRLSISTIDRMIKSGRIRTIQIGRSVRIVNLTADLGIDVPATAMPNRDRRKAERERIAAAALMGVGR